MKIDVLTIFPEMFTGVLETSIINRAQANHIVQINTINFRDYATDKHKMVDDTPYGGGGGMVLKPEPIFNAIEAIDNLHQAHRILMCPQGQRFNQKKAEELSKYKHLIFICGHYEGYDERIRQHLVDEEISIGDFVLTGGELPAMVVIDSVVRLLPDVLGNKDSHINDSFSMGLLEYPHYTRPQEFKGHSVPDVLVSGDHKKIEEWRRQQSLIRTFTRRPELLAEIPLAAEDIKFLDYHKKKLETDKKI